MAKIPLITIVGVPNTGKSTLFNRLIGENKALVHSSPGMTRDIYQKTLEIDNKPFKLQDSGGFFQDDKIITKEINKRIFREVNNSDLVLFLFDGRRELLGYEKELFLEIRKLTDRIIPIVNKVDHPAKYILPNSYYPLKMDFSYISAEHKEGIDDLLERMGKYFEDYKKSMPGELPAKPRISIIGKPNVGKSSIINKILNDDYVIVSPLAGTTRDSVDLEIKRKNKTFILVDNAGIRKLKKVKEETESAAVIRAEKDIHNADIVIFVFDVSKKIDQNDLLIAHKLLKAAKPVILAANKWDLVEDKEKSQALINKIRRSFNFFYFAPLLFISAETGKNIFTLLDKAESVHSQLHSTKIKTSYVNKVVQGILTERKLLTETGRPFSAKYITVESTQPFFVTFSTHSPSKIKKFHESFLKKRIIEELKLEGIPVFIKVSLTKRKSRTLQIRQF